MGEKSLHLFKILCKNSINIAQEAIKSNIENEQFVEYLNAFEALQEKLNNNPNNLDIEDYKILYIGADTFYRQLQNQMQAIKKQSDYYENNLLPMLLTVISDSNPNEKVKEVFNI